MVVGDIVNTASRAGKTPPLFNGAYAVAKVIETDGVWLAPEDQTPEGIAANWDAISSPEGEKQPQAGFEQTVKFTGKAMAGLGIKQD